MALPYQLGSPQKNPQGAANEGLQMQAAAPGGLATLKRIDNRIHEFTTTEQESKMD